MTRRQRVTMFISSINLKIDSNKIIKNNNNNDTNFTINDDGNNNVTDKNLLHRGLIFSGGSQASTPRPYPGVSRRYKGVATVSAVHEVSHPDVNSAEFVNVENKPSAKISYLIQQFNKVESTQRPPNLLPKKNKFQHLHQNQLVNPKNRESQSGNIVEAKKSKSSNDRSMNSADVVDRPQLGMLRIPEIALNFRIKANEDELLAADLTTTSETASYLAFSSSSSSSQVKSASRQPLEQVFVKSEEVHADIQLLKRQSVSPVSDVEITDQSDSDSALSNRHSTRDLVSDCQRKTPQNLHIRAVKISSRVSTVQINEDTACRYDKNAELKHEPYQTEGVIERIQTEGVIERIQTEGVIERIQRYEVDASHKNKQHSFRFPLVRSAGFDESHASATSASVDERVSTSAGVNERLSTSASVYERVSTSACVDERVSISTGVDERVSTSADSEEPHVIPSSETAAASSIKVDLLSATQSSIVTITSAYKNEILNYSSIEDKIVDKTTECFSNGREANMKTGQMAPSNSTPEDKRDSSDKIDMIITNSLTDPHIQHIPMNHPEEKIDGFGSKLHVLKSELMSLRQMDLVLLRQLMNISQSLQRIQRTQVPRVSRSLTFLNHKKTAQRRHWPVERQNSAPHVEHWRRFMFKSLQSATEDEITDSFSSFDESEFDSQSELEESTNSLNSPFVPSPRSAAANNRRFFQSRDRVSTVDVNDDLDLDYEGILQRNVQLWKSFKMHNSVPKEVSVWY